MSAGAVIGAWEGARKRVVASSHSRSRLDSRKSCGNLRKARQLWGGTGSLGVPKPGRRVGRLAANLPAYSSNSDQAIHLFPAWPFSALRFPSLPFASLRFPSTSHRATLRAAQLARFELRGQDQLRGRSAGTGKAHDAPPMQATGEPQGAAGV
jgi:hypothetical protein